MINAHSKITLAIFCLLATIISNPVFSRSSQSIAPYTNTPAKGFLNQLRIIEKQQALITPKPITKPTTKPILKVTSTSNHRAGTAHTNRKSISIKSTDAGMIPRGQQASGGCINCDTPNNSGLPYEQRIITDGIIRGVISDRIIQHRSHEHPATNPDMGETNTFRHQHPHKEHRGY